MRAEDCTGLNVEQVKWDKNQQLLFLLIVSLVISGTISLALDITWIGLSWKGLAVMAGTIIAALILVSGVIIRRWKIN